MLLGIVVVFGIVIEFTIDIKMPYLRKVIFKRNEDCYIVTSPNAKRGEYGVKKKEIIGFVVYRLTV